MKKAKTISLSFLFVLCLFTFATISPISIEARKYHSKKSKTHKNKQPKNGNNNPPNGSNIYSNQSSTFSIMSFGAKANGISDDSKALTQAWKSACKVLGGVIEIPSGYEFLIKPVTLQGPCVPNLVLKIDGTLLAPSKIGSWSKFSLYQWLNFKWIQNFTIQGSGIVDGQGSNWWTLSQTNYQMKKSKKVSDMKPTAMRFYASNNVTVRDIRIINSPLCHLKFDNSKQVKVENVTISAPETSPNTDGIHLQNSQDVEIMHSNIGTGDDCVSIQTGCSNIHIHDISCGPGHGVSLGGLGKGKTIACVSNILVENIVMENTLYGARIKTWQGGLGSVRNVTFSNIQVTDVKVPINIDQYYCDKSVCKNQANAVAISGVSFNQINGTYSSQPLRLACSRSIPCIDVRLTSIQLEPSQENNGLLRELCSNSYGKTLGQLVPASIDYCVRSGGDVVKRIARSRDNYGCFGK